MKTDMFCVVDIRATTKTDSEVIGRMSYWKLGGPVFYENNDGTLRGTSMTADGAVTKVRRWFLYDLY